MTIVELIMTIVELKYDKTWTKYDKLFLVVINLMKTTTFVL